MQPTEQHTSIRDLPLELLLSIFRLSFDIDTTSLQKDRCRLSLVCRWWRDIVQDSACLWIDISAHDTPSYVLESLTKSAELPIDVHYFSHSPRGARTYLPVYLKIIRKHLPRCRSISLNTENHILPLLDELFIGLQNIPAPALESLALKASGSHRENIGVGPILPQLPRMAAFPNLRRLEIDGVPCQISSSGLLLNDIRSLNLIDVTNVEVGQVVEVLRNSPHLERLELGRSPLACPSKLALKPIYLPHLMVLHLIFMPVQVSNYLLSTIHAPNCSELSISSHFPKLSADVVREHIFTNSTNHVSPILQRLLTGSKYRDVDVVRFDNGSIGFHLLFRDKEAGHFADHGNLRLEFKLHSVEQIEGTVRWLVGYLQPGVPKAPIRLYADGIEEVRLINVVESHWAITHFGFCLSSDPGATWPSPILAHLAQPAASGWPLPDLEVFVYSPGPQDEVMLDMLRRRYGQGSGEPDSGRLVPRPLRRVRIEPHQAQGGYLAGEVGRILPQAEIFLMENYKGSIWSL